MPRFFTLSHNSFGTRGFPWIDRIAPKGRTGPQCPLCKRITWPGFTEIEVTLEANKGVKWPHVLGCGAEPLFIVSESVIRAWQQEGIEDPPAFRVHVKKPYPEKLLGKRPLGYYWIDGTQMQGARLDFDASGFVDVEFCDQCGYRTDNISATFDRQHSRVFPCVFRPGSWNGENLFTTDLSPAAFFCTEAVLECARKHRLTNFRFVPVEEGFAASSKGTRYIR